MSSYDNNNIIIIMNIIYYTYTKKLLALLLFFFFLLRYVEKYLCDLNMQGSSALLSLVELCYPLLD